jgi:methyltransferase (TIGR00027 family)
MLEVVASELHPVATTARLVAAVRARESTRPDALFRDPLAEQLAGSEGRAMLEASEKTNPHRDGTSTYLVLRTRFLDDLISEAVEDGLGQVVFVAAGMDTRAFRLEWPAGVIVWELDRPELLELKQGLLGRTAPACRRMAVGTDLEREWAEDLMAAGFDPGQPALWITEGLFYYLEEPAVRHILREISALSAPGSRLAGDLVSASFLSSPFVREALRAMAERGHPWLFGTDEPEALLGEYGWDTRVVQPGEPDAAYDRWVFPAPLPRSVPGIPRMFYFSSEYAENC